MKKLTKIEAEEQMFIYLHQVFKDAARHVRAEWGDVLGPVNYISATVAISTGQMLHFMKDKDNAVLALKDIYEHVIKEVL